MTGLQPFTRVGKGPKNAEDASTSHSFNCLAAHFPDRSLSLSLGFATRTRCSRKAEDKIICPESKGYLKEVWIIYSPLQWNKWYSAD